MSENDRRKVVKAGSFTILTGLGATLVAGFIAWVANTTIENKVTFAPIVSVVDDLNANLQKQEERNIRQENRNTIEHNLIIEKLSKINSRINVNETKLFRVMDDCNVNHMDIKRYQLQHKGE